MTKETFSKVSFAIFCNFFLHLAAKLQYVRKTGIVNYLSDNITLVFLY